MKYILVFSALILTSACTTLTGNNEILDISDDKTIQIGVTKKSELSNKLGRPQASFIKYNEKETMNKIGELMPGMEESLKPGEYSGLYYAACELFITGFIYYSSEYSQCVFIFNENNVLEKQICDNGKKSMGTCPQNLIPKSS